MCSQFILSMALQNCFHLESRNLYFPKSTNHCQVASLGVSEGRVALLVRRLLFSKRWFSGEQSFRAIGNQHSIPYLSRTPTANVIVQNLYDLNPSFSQIEIILPSPCFFRIPVSCNFYETCRKSVFWGKLQAPLLHS